eukprot:9394249-Alexandrium_andersonii.AAC.1
MVAPALVMGGPSVPLRRRSGRGPNLAVSGFATAWRRSRRRRNHKAVSYTHLRAHETSAHL